MASPVPRVLHLFYGHISSCKRSDPILDLKVQGTGPATRSASQYIIFSTLPSDLARALTGALPPGSGFAQSINNDKAA